MEIHISITIIAVGSVYLTACDSAAIDIHLTGRSDVTATCMVRALGISATGNNTVGNGAAINVDHRTGIAVDVAAVGITIDGASGNSALLDRTAVQVEGALIIDIGTDTNRVHFARRRTISATTATAHVAAGNVTGTHRVHNGQCTKVNENTDTGLAAVIGLDVVTVQVNYNIVTCRNRKLTGVLNIVLTTICVGVGIANCVAGNIPGQLIVGMAVGGLDHAVYHMGGCVEIDPGHFAFTMGTAVAVRIQIGSGLGIGGVCAFSKCDGGAHGQNQCDHDAHTEKPFE